MQPAAARPACLARVVLVALLALGCGGSEPRPTHAAWVRPLFDASVPLDAAAQPATPEERWAALRTPDLARLVTEQASERIHEADPSIDLAHLPGWRADPTSAPELVGRVVERMLDLAVVDVARGALDDAERTIRLVRARARNRNSAWAANTLLCEIARRKAGSDASAQQHAIEVVLRELPRARLGQATVVFQIYQTQEQLGAELGELHQQLVSLDTASEALFLTEVLGGIVANRAIFLSAVGVVSHENEARPADAEYRFSTVDLAHVRGAHPVNVAVWDVGTSPDLFARQLYTNAREQQNGADDDGDGLVDDIHGIVSDGDAPNTALLFDPGADTIRQYGPFLQGVMDLRAGLASTPAAQRVLELFRAVTDVEQQKALDRSLDAIGEWAHGTHVAGLLLAGNPQARMAIFRSAWAGETRTYYERGPTDAEIDAERRNMEAVAAFIDAHRIRVVNASLGFSTDYLEGQLRHETAHYTSDDSVRARAREVQARRAASWRWVFEHCPDTLFVVAAGNENRDVVEYDDIPAALDAPNLLAVGAVDRWGGWATFTSSNPDRVRIFDHGVAVDSIIPSGEHVPLSGTSMASPNVANLAGKLFAVAPWLTPVRAIEIILSTGEPIAAPFDGRIAHEQRAIAMARREPHRPVAVDRP